MPAEDGGASQAGPSSSATGLAEVLSSLRMREQGQHVAASCDRCRRRKIKCDQAKPSCATCTRLGVRCLYSDILRKRGPPSKRERQALAELGLTFEPQRTRNSQARALPPAQAHAFLLDDPTTRIPPAPRTESGLAPLRRQQPYMRHVELGKSNARARAPAAIHPPPPPLPEQLRQPQKTGPDGNAGFQSDEVPGSASSVQFLLEKSNAMMPVGGGADQATAAVLQTRFSSVPGAIDPNADDDTLSRVYALNGNGQTWLAPVSTYPKRVGEVFAQQANIPEDQYLHSLGIDPTDPDSLRAGCIRLLAHPATKHMFDYIVLFANRAPIAARVNHVVERARHGAFDRISTHRLALTMVIASLAGSDCLPLPLDGGRAYATIVEFATALYKVAAAIAVPRFGATFGPVDPLELVQLQSWLSTAAAQSDRPFELMCCWIRSAWRIAKRHGLHRVQTDPRERTEPCSGSELRAELTVRTIWGIVIMNNFQLVLAPDIPPSVDEEVTCSYPRSVWPSDWLIEQIPVPHYSPEGFDAWAEYVRIHHIFQRYSLSVLAKPFWQDVEERGRRLLATAARNHSAPVTSMVYGSDFAAAPPPPPPPPLQGTAMDGLEAPWSDVHEAPEPLRSSMWIEATTDAVQDRQTLVDTLSDELMTIAADCHAFKAHSAQPKLNTGLTDFSGWVFVIQHALHIFGVCQERLAAAAADIEQGRASLMAMSCPLPPSVSGAFDYDAYLETASTASLSSYTESQNVYDGFSDAGESHSTQMSLGARSVPVLPGHRHRYGLGNTGAHRDVRSRLPRPPKQVPRAEPLPLAALRDRRRLEHRIADWISQVPGQQVSSYVVGDLSQSG